MTATSAGGSTCLPTKGLDISLAALRRQDPYINNIVDVASQVALYTFNNRTNEWEKTEVEGTLFVYTRLASPRHGFTIMNRLSMENLTEPITKELDFQLQDPFLLYRNARFVIHGIWFYDKQDCLRIGQRMKTLTQQEQALAQTQGGLPPLPPGGGVRAGGGGGGGGGEVGGGVEGHPVDILQMLANARNEYDKGGQSSSEPKEIGGSSMLFGNPHLIKPIPVKPITQDGEPGEPRSLSLATLFGSQPPHPSPSGANTGPLSPRAPAGTAPSPAAIPSSGSSKKPGGRPAVARSLSYDDPVGAPKGTRVGGGPATAAPGALPLMKGPAMGGDTAVTSLALQSANAAARGPVVLGPPGSPYSAYVVAGSGGRPSGPLPPHQPPQPPQPPQPQLCPAIQKLIQGPRGPGAPPPASLHTVSESPENRLCENGLTLEQHQHHLHHQHLHHQQHHQHHQHQHQQQHQQQHHHHPPQQHYLPQYQQSPQQDHLQRLFQAQVQAQAQAQAQAQVQAQSQVQDQAQVQAQAQVQVPVSTAPCCSNPPRPLIPSMQHLIQPITVESYPHPHPQHNQHVYFSPRKPHPDAGAPGSQQAPVVSSAVPGVAPHELLQKLQLVQQEQGQAPHEAPRHGPGFAPRFQGAAPTQDPGSALGPGDKEGMRFPVISPQRIPATVAPTLLLSPSVFSQAKPAGPPQDAGPAPGPPAPRPPAPEEAVVLSRSQLQDTLLHLIQTDSSFIDCIYKAYIGGLARDQF